MNSILPAPASFQATTAAANQITAFDQWAKRPADQRFQTLAALLDATTSRRMRSRGVTVSPAKMHASHEGNGLVINGGITPSSPTHWSFGQLSSWIGAPAAFLRDKLADRPDLLTANLNHCVSKLPADRDLKWLLIEPKDDAPDDQLATLQAVTSPTYGRIWDADVVQAIMRLQEADPRWHNPPAWSPGKFGDKTAVVPGGLYASDRDVFAFMIDGGSILEDSSGQQLNRGFFVSNSEVGSATFSLTTFLFRQCCGNHIIFGMQDAKTCTIRHTKGAPERFDSEVLPALQAYANSSVDDEQAMLKKAGDYLLPEKREELDTLLAKAAKFTKRETESALLVAKAEEGDNRTLWQLVQGFTAYARTFEHTDSRVDLERRAGRLMQLVK